MFDPKPIIEAYLAMAKQARYRPAAPSDGWGHVTLSISQAADPERLQKEAIAYAAKFRKEEDGNSYWIGNSDYETCGAFVLTIEAARCLACGAAGDKTALALLEMAAAELRRARVIHNRAARAQRITDAFKDA